MTRKESVMSMKPIMNSLLLDQPDDNDFSFPQEFIPIVRDNVPAIYDQSKKMMDLIVRYQELMMMYSCAIKEIRTKFEVLDAEFSVRHSRNPIKSIQTRLKRSTSLIEKMKRNHIPLSVEDIEENINDVAGIRVICAYIDDIYMISELLINQGDVELLSIKDYIARPKQNGYRSLHMIVRVPVHFKNDMKYMKVEVQFRTIAMDFWATLEHELKYKNRVEDESEIVRELTDCAKIVSEADNKMLAIRKRVEENSCARSEEEILIEQIKKMDHPMM